MPFDSLGPDEAITTQIAGGRLRHAWLTVGDPLADLSAAAEQVLACREPDAVLAALCAILRRQTPLARVFLWLKTPNQPDRFLGGLLVPSFAPWRPAHDEAGVWEACREVFSAEEAACGLRASSGEAMRRDPHRDWLAVPMVVDDGLVGVLYADTEEALNLVATRTWLLGLATPAAAALKLGRQAETLRLQAVELAKTQAKYRTAAHEASTDALTGLANRRCFLEQADRQTAIARRYGAPYAVLLIDVDHFKACNDIYGHAAGDGVLREMGRVLQASIRQPDLAARYGGEEFVILCPNTDERKAALLAERVRRAIASAQPQAEGLDLPLGITASIGVATFHAADPHVSAVLERADQALYAAKRAGRNRIVLADDTPEPRDFPKHG